jgi:hypothetical protein
VSGLDFFFAAQKSLSLILIVLMIPVVQRLVGRFLLSICMRLKIALTADYQFPRRTKMV